MGVTIRDVAKAARVSQAAVSRVLGRPNGSTTVRVGADTRRRILTTARRLGYSTNVLAQGLRQGKTRTIGLILESIGIEVSTQKAGAVEEQARLNGYRVFTCYHDAKVELEAADVGDLVARQVDGLIVFPVFSAGPGETDHYRRLAERNFPLVVFYGELPFPVHLVNVDNVYGGLVAVRHLVQIGRKRLAFIGGNPAYSSIRERIAGWKQGCEEAGLAFESMPFMGFDWDIAEEAGYQMCRNLIRSTEFDGLVVSNDLVALGALKALTDCGKRVPEDVAVVGFDDNRFGAYLPVPLTTVRQPTREVGETAFRLLLQKMEDPGMAAQRVLLKPTLVVRQSTMVARRGVEV